MDGEAAFLGGVIFVNSLLLLMLLGPLSLLGVLLKTAAGMGTFLVGSSIITVNCNKFYDYIPLLLYINT